MNYLKIYNSLILKRVSSPLIKNMPGDVERHHIVPRSFGGSNARDNLVYLSPREHFLAHRLLAKIHPYSNMPYAVWIMACMTKGLRITSRLYERLRKEHAERVSSNARKGQVTSEKLKGRPQSIEHISARVNSRKSSGIWHSKETVIKISEANKKSYTEGETDPYLNLKYSAETHLKGVMTRKEKGSYILKEEHKEKIRRANIGRKKPKSAATIENLKLAYMQVKVTCPHCGTTGSKLPMGRWHFNKCKNKEH